jgi:hypothetical protein
MSNITNPKRPKGVLQVVEHLASNCEFLSSNPSIEKKSQMCSKILKSDLPLGRHQGPLSLDSHSKSKSSLCLQGCIVAFQVNNSCMHYHLAFTHCCVSELSHKEFEIKEKFGYMNGACDSAIGHCDKIPKKEKKEKIYVGSWYQRFQSKVSRLHGFRSVVRQCHGSRKMW